MEKYSKAIAAAASGAVGGGISGAVFLPDGSPWYAYVIMTAITTLLPLVATYLAPRNTAI